VHLKNANSGLRLLLAGEINSAIAQTAYM